MQNWKFFIKNKVLFSSYTNFINQGVNDNFGKYQNMRSFISNIPIILLFILSGCEATYTNSEKITGYNLTSPDVSFILPDILHEISGLTYIDSTSFACIQDENGILFVYDAIRNEIKNQYTFHSNGDYEGITRIDKTIYVLRSDGTLFEISDYKSNDFEVNSYHTGIPARDNEGLCYDQNNNRLLIACKGRSGKGSKHKDKRAIYGFDLMSKTLTKKPVLEFDLQDIKKLALTNKVNLTSKSNKKGRITEPVIRFKTSDIAIHPSTGKLFLLSAADHLLFISDMNGNIEHIEKLNPFLFNQPEGITFFENGDMLISNEGKNRKATLLRFNYRKK